MTDFPETLPLPWAIGIFLFLLVALALVLVRTFRGPHLLDRVMCLDVIAVIVICLMVVWALTIGTHFFFDAVLVLTITGFITTVAFAKYLEDGDLID